MLGKTFLCSWSRISKAPGAGQSLHSDFVISSSLTYDWQLCTFSFFLPFSAQGHGGIWTPCLYFGIHVTLCTIIRDEIHHLFYNFSVLFMKFQHAPYFDVRMLGVGTDAYRFKKHYDIQKCSRPTVKCEQVLQPGPHTLTCQQTSRRNKRAPDRSPKGIIRNISQVILTMALFIVECSLLPQVAECVWQLILRVKLRL